MLQQLRSSSPNDMDRSLRLRNLLIAILSSIGIAIMVTFVQIDWDPGEGVYRASSIGDALKLVNLFLSFVIAVAQFDYYAHLASVQQEEWSFSSRFEAIRYSSLRWRFVLEVACTFLIPIPFVSMQGYGDKFANLMFLRCFLWVRAVRDFSEVYQLRRVIRASSELFRRTNPKFGFKRSLKMLFYERTVSVSIIVFIMMLLVSAFVIYTAERGLNDQFDSYETAIWFTWAASSSTGYGDVTPITTYGRLVAIFQGAAGIITLAILGGVVTNKLSPTVDENYARYYVRMRRMRRKEAFWAALLIQTTWRSHTDRMSPSEAASKLKNATKMLRKIRRFKNEHSQQLGLGGQNTASNGISEERFTRLQDDVRVITTEIRELRKLLFAKQRESVRVTPAMMAQFADNLNSQFPASAGGGGGAHLGSDSEAAGVAPERRPSVRIVDPATQRPPAEDFSASSSIHNANL
jgi:hypothetical protein